MDASVIHVTNNARVQPRQRTCSVRLLPIMAAIEDSSEYTFEFVVRGYHVYQDIWTAQDGEVLQCGRERSNLRDPFAVALVKNGTIVEHMPKKLSALSSVFLCSGSIECQLTGSKKFLRDLPQGGLEIPCKYIFRGKSIEIKKVSHVIKEVYDECEKGKPENKVYGVVWKQRGERWTSMKYMYGSALEELH